MTAGSGDGPSTSSPTDEGELYVGALVDKPQRERRQVVKPWQAVLAVTAGALTFGFGGLVAGSALSGLALFSEKIKDGIERRAKEVYHCCTCAEQVFDRQRYRCG